MHYQAVKHLVKQLKYRIQEANDTAQWQRVQYLKQKRQQLRKKLKAFEAQPYYMPQLDDQSYVIQGAGPSVRILAD